MTNPQTLTKAIEIPIKNGWNFMDYSKAKDKIKAFHRDYSVEDDGLRAKQGYECLECYAPAYTVEEIIFNHDFAKALFGEEVEYCDACHRKHCGSFLDCDCGVGDNQESWAHHLQQMVISENPIAYLANYLEENTTDA